MISFCEAILQAKSVCEKLRPVAHSFCSWMIWNDSVSRLVSNNVNHSLNEIFYNLKARTSFCWSINSPTSLSLQTYREKILHSKNFRCLLANLWIERGRMRFFAPEYAQDRKCFSGEKWNFGFFFYLMERKKSLSRCSLRLETIHKRTFRSDE